MSRCELRKGAAAHSARRTHTRAPARTYVPHTHAQGRTHARHTQYAILRPTRPFARVSAMSAAFAAAIAEGMRRSPRLARALATAPTSAAPNVAATGTAKSEGDVGSVVAPASASVSNDAEVKTPRRRKRIEVEYEESPEREAPASQSLASSPARKMRKTKALKVVDPPSAWPQQLENIVEMRRKRTAPVDTVGCEALADRTCDERTVRYQVLISLMLSSQTKDEVTGAAMARLKSHGCTVDNILATSEDALGKLIYPVGFWRTKAKHILLATRALRDRFAGDIPDTVEGLVSLPGVGPKMAHIAMNVAWGRPVGIGVDTHVHRISNRLGWVRTNEPEQTRVALESWLPRAHWGEINLLLVGFGQEICQPLRPKCGECLNAGSCPTGRKELRGAK